MRDIDEIAKRGQEQAVAAWANYLNQLRMDKLADLLARQDVNLSKAMSSVRGALDQIGRDVIDVNRGGQKGMHGFIAEVAEVGVGNARAEILGEVAPYQWVNDNGPVDLLREGVAIQQKFVASGGRFGLGAIAEHLEKYPDFIRSGGKYQIPRDHFEAIKRLQNMSPEDAGKLLSKGGDGPSLADWRRVNALFERGGVPLEALEPSHLEYAQVQRGTYEATLNHEKQSLLEVDEARRNEAHQGSEASLAQGVQATVFAAGIEGGLTFVLAVAAKRREGKELRDFTSEDWSEIASETGIGALKGGVRGLSIFTLKKFTPTSAAVASSIVTASFGVAEQANRFRRGEISEQEFIQNAELVTLEAAVNAVSALVGQALIPIPVLGAVIGSALGTIMYRSASTSLSKREAALIERYVEDQRLLDEELAVQYRDLLEELAANMATYVGLLDRAFAPDLQVALDGSVELALSFGVCIEDVLDSADKARAYFTE